VEKKPDVGGAAGQGDKLVRCTRCNGEKGTLEKTFGWKNVRGGGRKGCLTKGCKCNQQNREGRSLGVCEKTTVRGNRYGRRGGVGVAGKNS